MTAQLPSELPSFTRISSPLIFSGSKTRLSLSTRSDNFLVADAGAGQLPLGKQTSVKNRQCELLHAGTTSADDGAAIKATFHIRFLPAFRGAKHVWVMPGDG